MASGTQHSLHRIRAMGEQHLSLKKAAAHVSFTGSDELVNIVLLPYQTATSSSTHPESRPSSLPRRKRTKATRARRTAPAAVTAP